MKTFAIIKNKDSAYAYSEALIEYGYESAPLPVADFVIYDVERRPWKHADMILNRPAFIHPHTPASFWLWDGLYQPYPVCCNFVVTETFRECMQTYGYPHRVEAVGFHHCEVKPFTPTSGKRLLFVPPHPLGNGKYRAPGVKGNISAAFEFIVNHLDYFDHVTVCYVNTMENNGIYPVDEIEFIQTNPYKKNTRPAQLMVERIDSYDLVISSSTAGYLAVARGVPTIFIKQVREWKGKHWNLYGDVLYFPNDLEHMAIKDVMKSCEVQSPEVQLWKKQNIGGNFQKEKFIATIREFIM